MYDYNGLNEFASKYLEDSKLSYVPNIDTLSVLKFLVYPTDRLVDLANAPVIRPYQVDANTRTLGSFQDALSGNLSGKLSQNTINNLGKNLIGISESATQLVDIPNGWSTQRLSFICVLLATHNGQESLEVVTGYTTHNGISNSGAIDPNMGFIIDKITKIDKNTGVITTTDTLRREFISPMSNISVKVARPEDVITSINSDILGMGDYNSISTGLGEVVSNKVNNNIPTVYMGSIINAAYAAGSYARGSSDGMSWGTPIYSKSGIYNEMMCDGSIKNTNLMNFMIYRMLHLQTNNMMIDNLYYVTFTIPTLEAITHQNIEVISMTRNDTIPMSNGLGLVNTTIETVQAQNLFNIINTLAVNNYIQSIGFHIRFNPMENKYEVILLDQHRFMSLLSGPGLEWANNFILSGLNYFKNGLEGYINGYVYSSGDAIMFADVMYDMAGNTVINISINGGVMTPIVIPTYVSSSMSPMYNRQTQFNALKDAVTSVIDYIVPAN